MRLNVAIVSLFIIVLAFGCVNQKQSAKSVRIEHESDSVEYELLVMDAGFETYLSSIAKPKNFYSQNYYENWNKRYVMEWNSRYHSVNHGDIYGSYIDYDQAIDYGLDLNYQLYNYFLFFEKSNKVSLFPRAGTN